MTTAECVAWFENESEFCRRNLRIIVLVPNSDSCVFFVQEWTAAEWGDVGSGFSLTEAINNAADKIRAAHLQATQDAAVAVIEEGKR